MSQLTHALLFRMLEHVQFHLNANKIDFWLDGGSLLGAFREGTIIPHDDDIDLGYFERDKGKLERAMKKMCDEGVVIKVEDEGEMKEYKVQFITLPNMTKIYIPNLWLKNKINGDIIGTPTIDFFPYKVCGDKIKLSSVLQRQQFPNCYHLKDEFYPLQDEKFGKLTCPVPNNSISFLKRYYGNDCLQVIKKDKRDENNWHAKQRGK